MHDVIKELSDWGRMPEKPGLYLSLSHGRDYPQQCMRQRGFAGPKLGPLLYVQMQYAQRITIRFSRALDAKKFFPDLKGARMVLEVLEGSLLYGTKCYGCWDICFIAADFCESNQKNDPVAVKG